MKKTEREPNYMRTDHSELKTKGVMKLYRYFIDPVKTNSVHIEIVRIPVKPNNAGRYF